MSDDAVLRRIVAALGDEVGVEVPAERLVAALAGLPHSDLTSLLLAVMARRAVDVTPAQLLDQASRALVAPSTVDARTLVAIEAAGLAAAEGFEAIELAPVAPLGVDAVLGRIHPHHVITTTRRVQVLGDPTTAQTLEAARRRRAPADRAADVHLVSSARMVRMQPFDQPGFSPHFRLLALTSAGRDTGGHGFEARTLLAHLQTYLRWFRALVPLGHGFDPIEIRISDTEVVRALVRRGGVDPDELTRTVHAVDLDGGAAALAAHGLTLPRDLDPARDLHDLDDARVGRARLERVAAEVFPEIEGARCVIDAGRIAGLRYYSGLTLHIWVTAPSGARIPLVDGGFTDWTRRLLSDKKERLLVSGAGLEIIPKLFRR